jgi:DNA invertase Pin-like site-specific DNA recombinase
MAISAFVDSHWALGLNARSPRAFAVSIGCTSASQEHETPKHRENLQDIVRAVRAARASLKATEQPIDTSTAAGKCFLDMLGLFAEFETNLRRER